MCLLCTSFDLRCHMIIVVAVVTEIVKLMQKHVDPELTQKLF